MKTTQNRLCTRSQFTTQAINTTTKIAVTCFILSLTLGLTSGFGQTVQLQSPGCSTGAGSSPITQTNRCVATQNGPRNFTAENRLQAIGEASGWKHKYRSILVGAKINGLGDLSIFQKDPNSISDGYFDPNAPGSRIGIDGDGIFPTNCVYEREDEFLTWCQGQQMDEIILYGIADVLSKGSREAIEYDQPAPLEPFTNNLQEFHKAEWHIARFIRKAKKDYGLHVVAVLGDKTGNAKLFYDFQEEFSRNGFSNQIGDLTDDFFQMYANLWLMHPEQVDYVEYDEDTLFFPKDASGRISYQDKMIKDVYNYAVYEFRLRNNYIQKVESSCTTLPDPDVNCEMNFDAYMIEWEWWLNYSDTDFDDMKSFLRNVKKKLINEEWACKPEVYVFQNEFGVTASSNYTEQQRADSIDKWADRIYLYSYHKNPCDSYWGYGSSSLQKKFYHKVQLLSNNNFGSAGGRTVVVPVFNAKFYNYSRALAANYPNPNYTQFYNDQKFDCQDADGDGIIEIRECDYCQNYTGHFLNELKTYNAPWPGAWSFNSNLGYMESIFQDQYDLDQNNFNNGNQNNIIFGYAWLKFSLLYENDFISSIDVAKVQPSNSVIIYPNPTSGLLRIESTSKVSQVAIYDMNGRLIQNNMSGFEDGKLMRMPAEHGLYILQITNATGIETFKVQVQ
jgi:hypothetical protein